jgi:serpin B
MTDKHIANTSQLLAPTADFGFAMLRREVSANPGKNVLISPTSVSIALAMVANGAVGSTKDEMALALGIDSLGDSANQSYWNLVAALDPAKLGVELAIANALWTHKGFDFLPSFMNANRQYFNAGVNTSDFADPSTLDAINNWVFDNTKGKIGKILNSISPDKIMFVLNAVYFKGHWTTKFDKSGTRDKPFTTPKGERLHPIMFRTDRKMRYTQSAEAQVVALPFGDPDKARRISLIVLLPQLGKTVENVVNELTADALAGYYQQMRGHEVNLHLPKFEVEYDTTLNGTLKALGMNQAFDSVNADFSGLLPKTQGNPCIGEVKHKTFARIDEDGAEAAAITSVGIGMTCLPPPPVDFNVNRPFVALIADEDSGAVLFAGVINDPKAPA